MAGESDKELKRKSNLLRAKFRKEHPLLEAPKNFTVRKFLNKLGHFSVGSILAKFDCHHSIYSNEFYASVDLQISDCSRKIELSLPVHEDKEIDNTIYKLTLIVDTLNQLIERIKLIKEYRKAWHSFVEESRKLDNQSQ